jgi:cytochrome c
MLLSALALSASASMAFGDGTDTIARGKSLVVANCSICHAVGKTGESPRRDAPPFRIVMRSYGAASLSEALAEGLLTGHPDMPEFVFEAKDVGAIVDYLHTLEGM